MSLPKPEAGLVIGYSYLWRREEQRGQEEGIKDRPCAIVLKKYDNNGKTIVIVAAITHVFPTDPESAIEIPLQTKHRLGLDSSRSWIVVNEVNHFAWPGSDLRPISSHEPDRFSYGFLPPRLLDKVAKAIGMHAKKQRLHIVIRTD